MAKTDSSKRRKATKSKEEVVDFETSLAKAEEILTRLESGQLGLTESLEQYEAGIKHLKQCHALLDAAEQRVTLLSGFDADGNPIEEPLPRAAAARQSSGQSEQGDRVDDVPGLF